MKENHQQQGRNEEQGQVVGTMSTAPKEEQPHRSRRKFKPWSLGLAGFGFGVLSSGGYLLLGGEYFWSIPLYAKVLFYPGFVAGYQSFEWGLRQPAAKGVGVFTVGVFYGLLLVFFASACKLDAKVRATFRSRYQTKTGHVDRRP